MENKSFCSVDAEWLGLRTRVGPTGPAKRVLGSMQVRNQTQVERKSEQS